MTRKEILQIAIRIERYASEAETFAVKGGRLKLYFQLIGNMAHNLRQSLEHDVAEVE